MHLAIGSPGDDFAGSSHTGGVIDDAINHQRPILQQSLHGILQIKTGPMPIRHRTG